jgi:spore germination protein KC
MKKIICILIYILIIISLSGCWDRIEPKTMAIANSAIYDIEDDGTYRVTVEFMNPTVSSGGGGSGGGGGGGSGGKKSPSITETGEAKAPAEAIRNVSLSLDKYLFAGHNNARIFSERLAKKGVLPTIDFLLRDHLTDETPLMLVVKGDHPDLLYSCSIGLSDMLGDYIKGLNDSQNNSITKAVFITLLDFIKDYYTEGRQPVMGLAEIVESQTKPSGNTITSPQETNNKNYKIKYEGLAAFKEGNLVGYLNGDEARSYSMIVNDLKVAHYTINHNDYSTVIRVDHSGSDIKTNIDNGKIIINVNVTNRVEISQEGDTTNITKIDELKKIEKEINEQIKNDLLATIKKVQTEFVSDIFGFGIYMHNQHPKEWKNMKDNWDEIFSKATINVEVKTCINRTGEIREPFKLEVYE